MTFVVEILDWPEVLPESFLFVLEKVGRVGVLGEEERRKTKMHDNGLWQIKVIPQYFTARPYCA